MTSKEALDNLVYCKSITKCKECRHKNLCSMERDYNIIKQDLERFNELVKVIRILKTKKYAEWIKNKFYDDVGYDEKEEKLFEKVFGSSWRKY